MRSVKPLQTHQIASTVLATKMIYCNLRRIIANSRLKATGSRNLPKKRDWNRSLSFLADKITRFRWLCIFAGGFKWSMLRLLRGRNGSVCLGRHIREPLPSGCDPLRKSHCMEKKSFQKDSNHAVVEGYLKRLFVSWNAIIVTKLKPTLEVERWKSRGRQIYYSYLYITYYYLSKQSPSSRKNDLSIPKVLPWHWRPHRQDTGSATLC